MKQMKSRLLFKPRKESYDSLAIQTDFWTKTVSKINSIMVIKMKMNFLHTVYLVLSTFWVHSLNYRAFEY